MLRFRVGAEAGSELNCRSKQVVVLLDGFADRGADPDFEATLGVRLRMGLKPRTGGDDFANTVMALTSEFPDIAAFIAGHTHQAIPSRLTNRVLFTEADHFGIHVGRVDLLFDRNSKRLLRREAICERMDNRFDPDHVVLSRAGSQLAESEAALAQPIGELKETLHARGRRGYPSEIEKLIGAAIVETLAERSVIADAVMHGVFDENAKLAAGLTTINDVWNIIPYENLVVTATLLPDEIKGVMVKPPILCTHLPSERPRTAIHPRPATIAKLTSETHHLLRSIQAALSPIAYEMFVVTNMPPSAITMIESNHKFHATMKPANSLNASLAHW